MLLAEMRSALGRAAFGRLALCGAVDAGELGDDKSGLAHTLGQCSAFASFSSGDSGILERAPNWLHLTSSRVGALA